MDGAVSVHNGTPRPKATSAGGELPVLVRAIVSVAAVASVPPLPLLRRRADAPQTHADSSVPPISGPRRKPTRVLAQVPRRELASTSLAGKRLLLAGMGTLVLCVQVCAMRLARTNANDFWPALARATAGMVRGDR